MKRITLRSLGPVIEEFGIQRTYRAADGQRVTASTDALIAGLHALGADGTDFEQLLRRTQEQRWHKPIEPVLVAWDGILRGIVLHLSGSALRGRIDYEIALEGGGQRGGALPASCRSVVRSESFGRGHRSQVTCSVDLQLPLGYHQLTVQTADGAGHALIISAPRKCYAGDHPREWGVFAPLYAMRSSAAQAIGNFSDLEKLMRWTGEMGGDVVATLPISAAFLSTPFDPSPYSPASRLFWNELYVKIDHKQSAALQRAAASELVDYQPIAQAKRAVLEKSANAFFEAGATRSKEYRAFLKLYPDIGEYAQFRANGEKRESGWPGWPAKERNGQLPSALKNSAAARYHQFAQFEAHKQLVGVANCATDCGVRLYLDLPLGVHPDSYDVWRNRDLFIAGASAGAPPDPFFTRGQNWGFPPMHPLAMREQGYAYWRRVIQTQLRYAGILRLDHVMSLHRLYIVPNGMEATDGVYVRYPQEELFAVLTLESARHNAVIVGEDLGTVPAEVRTAMSRHGVKRMFVVQFEAIDDRNRPLNEIPKPVVASLNTHDMPPFASYWEAHDADMREELGLLDEAGVRETRASRERIAEGLSRLVGSRTRLATAAARTALLRYLARSRADVLLLNLEDIWLETEPQNVPGTSHEKPNWRRRLKLTLDEVRTDPTVRDILRMVEEERRRTYDGNNGNAQ